MSRPQVGVIGAGVAGLAAARELSCRGISSVVLEKSRGLSGRAATRRRGASHFDYGANFFRLEEPEVASLLREVLPEGELNRIERPVWTFDREGVCSEGTPARNDVPRWSCAGGISMLGKALHAAAPLAEVRKSCQISRLVEEDGHWTAIDADEGDHGPFDSLLVTLPCPQAAQLLRDSGASAEWTGALEAVRYEPQFSFVLGFQPRLSRPGPFHALVNSDGGHPVAWLSFEDDKPGHVPGNESILVVQMASWWTRDHFEEEPAQLMPLVREALRELVPVPDPAWWDSQRWRYAHPVDAANAEWLGAAGGRGLFFAGDGLVGKGRVPLAVRSGLDAAARIASRHESMAPPL